jgi:hypothetical protein
MATVMGLVVGVFLSGVVVAVMVPVLPTTWHSERLVGAVSLGVVALSAGAAFVMSGARRQ